MPAMARSPGDLHEKQQYPSRP